MTKYHRFCKKCGKMADVHLMKLKQQDGGFKYGLLCTAGKYTHWINTKVGGLWISPTDLIAQSIDPTLVPEYSPFIITETEHPMCAVCGRDDVQLHHWLPQGIAPIIEEDAEHWPKSYLCTYHHDMWHQSVWPGRGHEEGNDP